MSNRQLIVNADDFGIGQRTTDGIIDSHIRGIITSTTLMANMPAAEYACQCAKKCPELGVGIHLNLTEGRPICAIDKVSGLVDKDGKFLNSVSQCRNLWNAALAKQVECEFEAQIKRALDLGIRPTHFDSHHGVHKRPVARATAIRLSQQFNIPAARSHMGLYRLSMNASGIAKIKWAWLSFMASPHIIMRWYNHYSLRRAGLRTPDHLVEPSLLIPFLEDSKKTLLACIEALPQGISELVLHPGYPDPDVPDSLEYAEIRKTQRELASDPEVLATIKSQHIDLISFRNL